MANYVVQTVNGDKTFVADDESSVLYPKYRIDKTAVSNEMISQFLDLDGDGTGIVNANGNYSVTPGIFYIAPTAGVRYKIRRLIVFVRDTGAFDADKYGNNITLANGIVLRKSNSGGVVKVYTQANPVLSNAGWGMHCFDIKHHAFGTGDEFLNVRWTFSNSGTDVDLDGDNGDKLEIYLNDNFTGLVNQCFLVQGYIV